MNTCLLCGCGWMTYSLFARHMIREHEIDRETLWARIGQAEGNPVTAVRSERGRWSLFVQGSLEL